MNQEDNALLKGTSQDVRTGRHWDPPSVEEVDYGSTQAIYGPPGTADAGIYHS
jgi:hypothetical protein